MAETKRKRRETEANNISDYAIYLENVCKTFSDGVPALSDINLKVKHGEFVFIVGVSGAGKSTLIKLLLRELKADSGTIYVNGFNLMNIKHGRIPKFRRTLGVVFQDFRLLKDRNVYENVAFAQRVAQKSEREIRRNVPGILSLVGLAGKYKAKPKQLAGGEQQRVALARALVNQPKLLLADEPTGNLDLFNTAEIMRLLETVNENGTTVVVVTHNDKLVNDMKKRVVTIKQGMIVSDDENGGYFDED
ncbi:MAG: cell division ATP-binding protein FtsE [Lachnospiraceae bacterium]|nr:cell division ATP-binding protein FtsE [Lachnospiraceae bacterium]